MLFRSLPSSMAAAENAAEKGWRWDKAACRFCGTGCGVMIATKEGKIVAVKGDPEAPVNRGLNCIKGYFNAKIMYGADRIAGEHRFLYAITQILILLLHRNKKSLEFQK